MAVYSPKQEEKRESFGYHGAENSPFLMCVCGGGGTFEGD